MTQKPILILPAATKAARAKLNGSNGVPGPHPSRQSQDTRLTRRLETLTTGFGTAQLGTEGIDPEQVVVFEIIGSVTDFQKVILKIPGLEWLGEFDADVEVADPGFLSDGSDSSEILSRLFVMASNRAAYARVLGFWKMWTAEQKLPHGYAKFAEAFKLLNDIRRWGVKDRVALTGVYMAWEAGLSANMPKITFEAELWCRENGIKRQWAFNNLQTTVQSLGGQCLTQSTIKEIDYHAALIELPASEVRQMVEAFKSNSDTPLLRLMDIKCFSPINAVSIEPSSDKLEGPIATVPPLPTKPPIAALLDGMPLSNHAMLQGRLEIDDPNNLAATYLASEFRHGTAMASLITLGELEAGETALSSKLYVRPLMQPGPEDSNGMRREEFPPNTLPVDLVHLAVKRMKDGEAGQAPTAPTVKIINLSLGDSSQPFDRQMSPWARLLDWLSWKYKILFIVSSGNYFGSIPLAIEQSKLSTLTPEAIRDHLLRSMAEQRIHRRLLAPAESVNALTIGALHDQIGVIAAGRLIDLAVGAGLPSPISTVASGFGRSVKPEIFVPGGRLHYQLKRVGSNPNVSEFEVTNAIAQPGQLVAATGGASLPPNNTVRSCGTSNAAALATRQAAILYEGLLALRTEAGGDILTDERIAVLLKAILVHGASWGDLREIIDNIFGGSDKGNKRTNKIKKACSQFLGYGAADFQRSTICTDQRVIVMGCSELGKDEGHLYHVPLPTALNAQTVRRRLAVTLAWLTPINALHRNYAQADLWFDLPTSKLQVKRSDVIFHAAKNGTVQHEVFDGDKAVVIAEGDMLPIRVSCRSDATGDFGRIPYALMVSLETAHPLAVSIYEQVKLSLEQIHASARIRPTVRS